MYIIIVVAEKARRLTPQKLKNGKLEFKFMTEQAICRPSNSIWSCPLHMIPKENSNPLKPCGNYRNYRRLNCSATYKHAESCPRARKIWRDEGNFEKSRGFIYSQLYGTWYQETNLLRYFYRLHTTIHSKKRKNIFETFHSLVHQYKEGKPQRKPLIKCIFGLIWIEKQWVRICVKDNKMPRKYVIVLGKVQSPLVLYHQWLYDNSWNVAQHYRNKTNSFFCFYIPHARYKK